MTRKIIFNLILVVFLALLFPLLWLYNQRLNYRSFLTLDTKFSLDANTLPPEKLSSVQFVLDYLRKQGLEVEFNVDVINPDDFDVLGRVIETPKGAIEVYEYSSKEDASKKFRGLAGKSDYEGKLYQYKNILIYNKDAVPQVDKLMEDLTDEKID